MHPYYVFFLVYLISTKSILKCNIWYDPINAPAYSDLLEISWALEQLPSQARDKEAFERILNESIKWANSLDGEQPEECIPLDDITTAVLLKEAVSLVKKNDITDPTYLLLKKASETLKKKISFHRERTQFKEMLKAIVILKDQGMLCGEDGLFYLNIILNSDTFLKERVGCLAFLHSQGLLNTPELREQNIERIKKFYEPALLLRSLKSVHFLMKNSERAQQCFDTLITLEEEFDGHLDIPLTILTDLNLLTYDNLTKMTYSHAETLDKLCKSESILLDKEHAQSTYDAMSANEAALYYLEHFADGFCGSNALTLFEKLQLHIEKLYGATNKKLDDIIDNMSYNLDEKISVHIFTIESVSNNDLQLIINQTKPGMIGDLFESMLTLCDVYEKDELEEKICLYFRVLFEGVVCDNSNVEAFCMKSNEFLTNLIQKNLQEIKKAHYSSPRFLTNQKRKEHFEEENSKRFKHLDESDEETEFHLNS